MATYTFDGKRGFAGEFVGSLAAFYCERWSTRSVTPFVAGFALFVRFKSGFADHI